jgi:hypothetical protein
MGQQLTGLRDRARSNHQHRASGVKRVGRQLPLQRVSGPILLGQAYVPFSIHRITDGWAPSENF